MNLAYKKALGDNTHIIEISARRGGQGGKI